MNHNNANKKEASEARKKLGLLFFAAIGYLIYEMRVNKFGWLICYSSMPFQLVFLTRCMWSEYFPKISSWLTVAKTAIGWREKSAPNIEFACTFDNIFKIYVNLTRFIDTAKDRTKTKQNKTHQNSRACKPVKWRNAFYYRCFSFYISR